MSYRPYADCPVDSQAITMMQTARRFAGVPDSIKSRENSACSLMNLQVNECTPRTRGDGPMRPKSR
jgi:hypothetical protein